MRKTYLMACCAVLILATALRFYALGRGSYGEPFYAGTVWSMMQSFHNFFFVTLDPLGTYMSDKPPVALWLQTLSCHLLGYTGFALMLPQAVAGTLAVLLLLWLGYRMYGPRLALTAAALMAVLPSCVLTARSNKVDTVFMAATLTTVALVFRYGRTGRRGWLIGAAVMGGIAFNVKTMALAVALPAMVIFIYLSARPTIRQKCKDGALACVAFVLVAASWMTVVDLTPADRRPLVLNSHDNSVWSLTIGYNGLNHVAKHRGLRPKDFMTPSKPDGVALGVIYGGPNGPARLTNEFPAPLIAFLYPLLAAGSLLLLLDLRHPDRRAAAALWLTWLLCGLASFMTARLGSAHYFEFFSPALVVVAAYPLASEKRVHAIFFLVVLAAASAYAGYRYNAFDNVGTLILWASVVSALTAILLATRLALLKTRWTGGLRCVAIVTFLIAPLSLSMACIRFAPTEGVLTGSAFLVIDGKRDAKLNLDHPGYAWIVGRTSAYEDALEFLEARHEAGTYAVAVQRFYLASSIIANRHLPALALYNEFSRRAELPEAMLREFVEDGRVRYFLVHLESLERQVPYAADLLRRHAEDISSEAGIPRFSRARLYRIRGTDGMNDS